MNSLSIRYSGSIETHNTETVLLYASVSDTSLFNVQGFYRYDKMALENAGYKVILTNRFDDFLRSSTYDIALLYFYKRSLLPAVLARVHRKPVYFTGGNDDLSPRVETNLIKRGVYRLLSLACILVSTRVLAVSTTDVAMMRRLALDRRKVIFSPHGVEVRVHLNRADFESRDTDFVTICWMGSRRNPIRKGLDKAIKLFALYSRTRPSARFLVLGKTGIGTNYVKNVAREFGVEDKIVFTGFVSEEAKARILNKSKYYAQLSIYEGFGLGALEALVAGCVVIHSNQGGLKDTIGDHGIVVTDSLGRHWDIEAMEELLSYERGERSLVATVQNHAEQFSINARSRRFKEDFRNPRLP